MSTLFERQVLPRISYYVAGIDPEFQVDQLPEQTGVSVIERKPRDTVCLALGTSYISLFSAMLLICSCIMIAFSSWALHFKATGSAAALLVCNLYVFFLAFVLILRNVFWPCGSYLSMVMLTILIIGQIIAAIYFTGFSDSAVNFVYKHDTTSSEKYAMDHGLVYHDNSVQSCSCSLANLMLARNIATTNATSSTPLLSDTDSPNSNVTYTLSEEVPLDKSWNPPRANLGQYFHDNLLLIRPICWIAVGFQLFTMIVLIFTHLRFKKLQVFERLGTVTQ